MGANIKIVKLHQALHEDETSRISRNFVKSKDLESKNFNSCDHATYLTGGGVAPHNHVGVEEVFYFIRGEGVFTLNGQDIPVKAGSVVAVPPESYHGIRNTGNDILQHIVCSARV